MGTPVGLEALISAGGASTDFGYLLNTSTLPSAASVNLNAEALDATGFGSTAPISVSIVQGLAEWSGTFTAKYPRSSPASGHEGLVTFASGYTVGAHSWTISASATEHAVTAFNSTPPVWKSFTSGLYSYSGSFLVRADDSTALGGIVSGAATFRASTETTNDNEFSGNILITGRSSPFEVNGNTVIQYSFVFTGALSFDGDNALFDVSTPGTPDPMVRPQEQAITLRINSGGTRDMSGTAFLTGWTIGATLGQIVECSGSFRGTGALADT